MDDYDYTSKDLKLKGPTGYQHVTEYRSLRRLMVYATALTVLNVVLCAVAATVTLWG